MQKGIPGILQMITQMLDGLSLGATEKVLVVDCMCNRFNEWGLASWKVQQDVLAASTGALCNLHFMGFVWADEDGEFSDRLPSQISAQILEDSCC